MTTRRNRGAPGAFAMLMLFAMLTLVPAARAAETAAPADTTEGWRKVVSYARCAFAVFRAVTPLDWGAAMFDCTRTFIAELPPPAGGA